MNIGIFKGDTNMQPIDPFFYVFLAMLPYISYIWISYLKAKGKNKALIEDNPVIEQDKQKIITKYKKEIEELKKLHSLDLEKRKYRYDDKRKQFSSYLSLTLNFQEFLNDIINSRLPKIIGSNGVPKNIEGIIEDINRESTNIIIETNNIKLISSEELDVLFDELEETIRKYVGDITKYLSDMYDNSAIDCALPELIDKNIYVSIRNRMKVELNEI